MTKNDFISCSPIADEYKFFVRFLKDEGILTRFRFYLTQEKVKNFTKIRPYIGWNIFDVLNKYQSTHNIISLMFIWAKTKEGDRFWRDKNEKYNSKRVYFLKHHEQ